jgi:hypothetical protein
VAFPKSYEKYRELLTDDALLCVTAKVDKSRRDDSLQLLLETAAVLELEGGDQAPAESNLEIRTAMDFEGRSEDVPSLPEEVVMFAPNDDAPHPAEATTRPPAPTPAFEQPAAPPAPAGGPAAETTPAGGATLSIIKPRVKIGANGNGHSNGNGGANGNGHSNGNGGANGNGHSAGSGYTMPPPPVATNLLRVYLPRTADLDADVALMHKVDRMLRQSEGDDQVIIHMPNAAGTVLLKPRHTVHCSDALVGELQGVLGAQSVFVER